VSDVDNSVEKKVIGTIPGKNGGRLNRGGTKGNKGGTGRPPSVIRQKLRGSFEDRIMVIAAIADDQKASTSDRLRALDLMAKYGLGTTSTSTVTEGNDVQRPGRLTPDEIEAELKRIAGGN
jgi:hypothetical protein